MFHQDFSGTSNSRFGILKAAALVGTLAVGAAFAQPTPPPGPYLPCQQEPKGEAMNDTVPSGIDADGFISLFDGKTQKGWWQSCGTGHNGPAKWKIVPELDAIFSTQDGQNGGVLMTNKKFTHYELVWEYWPDYNNDGGIFNRTDAGGNCFQTVLDYINNASLGGTWGERGFGHRDFRPFKFSGNENTIAIPGLDQPGDGNNWTTTTAKLLAAGQKFPCPTTGCTQEDWRKLWDFDNWNQLRIQFYGGQPGDSRVRMKSWFRKVGATQWVPISADTTLMRNIDPGYIGLQVHGGGRFSGAKGTWYRNIKWTPLTAKGERIYTASTRTMDGKVRTDLKVGSRTLRGSLDLDHEITIKDIKGVTIQVIKGKAGQFEYSLSPHANGWLSMQIKTAKGIEHRSFVKDNIQ